MGNWPPPFNIENGIFSPLNACHILAEASNQENATPKISSFHTEIFPRVPTAWLAPTEELGFTVKTKYY